MTETTTVRVVESESTTVTVHVDESVTVVPGPPETTVILAADIGPRGPKGDEGEIGPSGLSAYEVALLEGFVGTEAEWLESLKGADGEGVGHYTHVQAMPDTTWTVVHNLGYFPNLTVFDSLDREVEGDISHVDTTTLTVTFTAGFSGRAYLS